MLAFSRLVFGFLNVLALAFSIFQIIFAIIENPASNSYKSCNKKSAWLILWFSVFLLIMSLIGLLASCLRSRVLQAIYFAVAVVVTLVSVVITVFTFAALPKSSADATRLKALDKNWLNQFSPLLQGLFVNGEDWGNIDNCLKRIDLCRSLKNGSPDSQAAAADQNFLQLGCCMPPKRCGFAQKNGTYTTQISQSAASEKDCQDWGNSIGNGGYCFDCDSCKAGYLAQFQADWRANGGIFIGIAVTLVIVTFLSFYILRFNKDYLEHNNHERIYPRTPSNAAIGEISIWCPEAEAEVEVQKHPQWMLGRVPMERFNKGRR